MRPLSLQDGAKLVRAGYERQRAIRAGEPVLETGMFGVAGWELLHEEQEHAVQMYAVRSGGQAALVLPGTDEGRDWLKNISFWPEKIPGTPGRWRGGVVESGELAASILDRMNRAHEGLRWTIVCHSLGGMVGQATVAYLQRDWGAGASAIAAQTFGSPRACTKKAALWISGPFRYRVTLGVDAVPHLVPGWWSHAFMHKNLGGARNLRQAWRQEGFQMLRDHSISEYAKAAAERDTGELAQQ